MTKMKIFAIDELNEVIEVTNANIPYDNGELTDNELDIIYQIAKSRVWIAPEWSRMWFETTYKTKEALIREEEELEGEFKEWLEFFGDDSIDEDELFTEFLEDKSQEGGWW